MNMHWSAGILKLHVYVSSKTLLLLIETTYRKLIIGGLRYIFNNIQIHSIQKHLV